MAPNREWVCAFNTPPVCELWCSQRVDALRVFEKLRDVRLEGRTGRSVTCKVESEHTQSNARSMQ